MIIYMLIGENKVTIKKRLMAERQNPLLELEKWATETHYVRRQVGFCAQWCLDNLCKYNIISSSTIYNVSIGKQQ